MRAKTALLQQQTTKPSWVYELKDGDFFDPACPICETKPYVVVECTQCGLTYVTPQRFHQALLDDLYEERLWSSPAPRFFGYGSYREEAENYMRTFRKRSRVIGAFFKQPGSLLDLGCAAGYFMNVMREQGWETEGIEPSQLIARFGREEYGAAIRVGTAQTVPLAERAYDLVTMWDVIEHLSDPIDSLSRMRKALKPEGYLLLETQNIDSIFARLLGKRWHHFKHAEHLWHFSPRTIEAILAKAGFDVVEIRSSMSGKYVKLSFIAERLQRLNPLLSRAANLVTAALRDRSLYVNVHDEMIVVARPSHA
jgi:SAM-dependent methyltransferase